MGLLDDPKYMSFVHCTAVRETPKAVLVDMPDYTDDQVWVPKSQIHDDSEVWEDSVDGGTGTLIVSTWWAEQRDLA